MAVSLRLLMSLIIATVAIIAATVAFVPTYFSGVEGVRSALADLRSAYAGRALDRTQSFFDAPMQVVENARRLTARGLLRWSLTTPADKAAHYAFLFDLVERGAPSSVIQTCTLLQPFNPNPEWYEQTFIYVDSRLNKFGLPPGAVEPNTTGTDLRSAANAPLWLFAANGNGTVLYQPWIFQRNYNILISKPFMEQWTTYGAVLKNPSLTVEWAGLRAGYDRPMLPLNAVMRDPNGVYVGGLKIDVQAERISTFLTTLGLRKNGRGIAVDVLTGVVIGLSSTEPIALLLPRAPDFIAPDHLRMQYKTLNNVTDPLIREVVRSLGSFTLLNATTPSGFTMDSSLGVTYVDVVEVRGPGLQVRIILIMPEIDFLSEVYASQRRTIGGVAGAAVVMIILALVLGHVMTLPFTRLRDRMYLTASLQDDSTVDSPSLLQEVKEMQESYELMRGELAKVKSYLPQSVLIALRRAASGDEDAEGEDEEEQAEEDVSQGKGSPRRGTQGTTKGQGSASPSDKGKVPRKGSHVGSEVGSTRSSYRPGAGAAAHSKLFNDASNLVPKRVSVAVFNLRGFHRFCGTSSVADITSMHAKALELVAKHVAQCKGVVDFFQGDHIQASWNAVSPAAAHSKRAAIAALELVKEFRQDAGLLHMSVGLSTGSAQVGNIGSSSLRRFCVVGPAVSQASGLERMTRLFQGVSVLCPSSMFAELQLELLLQFVGIVTLPGTAQPQLVASVEGLKQMSTDEWMYQLQEGEDADPFARLNEVFTAVKEEDAAAARKALNEVLEHSAKTNSERLVAGQQRAQQLVELLESKSPAITDSSSYWTTCITTS
jgi:class 3 adenylate cyclase